MSYINFWSKKKYFTAFLISTVVSMKLYIEQITSWKMKGVIIIRKTDKDRLYENGKKSTLYSINP